MSIQKIVDYVMHTPHNTNPAILKQVINDNISWNDLKDKPFGTGTETVVVLEETTLMNFNTAGTAEFTPAASLEEGKTYTVVWNGTKYSCVAFYLKSWDGCCIGNRSKIGFTDNTGEPFAIITGNSTSVVVAGKGCTTATISITTEKEIIHTIDPKYLPSGGGCVIVSPEDYGINLVSLMTGSGLQTAEVEGTGIFDEFTSALQNGQIVKLKQNVLGTLYVDLPLLMTGPDGTVDWASGTITTILNDGVFSDIYVAFGKDSTSTRVQVLVKEVSAT